MLATALSGTRIHAVTSRYQAASPKLLSELDGVLAAAGFSERQALAVRARLGWDGRGGSTLAAAGEEHGYTRERVRQLERRVEAHLRRAPLLPAVEAALGVIAEAAPAARHTVALALRDAGLALTPFDPAGVLTAAALAGIAVEHEVSGQVVVGRGDEGELERILPAARRLARLAGAASATAVARATGSEPQRVARLLQVSEDVVWLGCRDWFGMPARRNRLAGRLRKALAVSGSLPLAELPLALWRRPALVPLPVDVLAALCRALEWVAINPHEGTVCAAVPLDERSVLAPAERVVVSVLREHGPLGLDAGVRLVAERGVNPGTAGIWIRYAPVVTTVGQDRYAVCGAGDAIAIAA
jgi:Sigma-70, region 4